MYLNNEDLHLSIFNKHLYSYNYSQIQFILNQSQKYVSVNKHKRKDNGISFLNASYDKIKMIDK